MEKVVVEMGYLMEKLEEEEGGGGGVVVVVVVGMEEKMEEEEVEELVVKMEVEEVEHGRPRQGPWLPFVGLLAGNGEGKKCEREREECKEGVYI